MRLIDADKLKAHYAWWKGGSREMTMDEAKSDFDTIIDLQPTVEAEPIKHGRWKNVHISLVDPDGVARYGRWGCQCSICGTETADITPYCPNCGARMDAQIGEDKSHPFAESVMMGKDGGDNG